MSVKNIITVHDESSIYEVPLDEEEKGGSTFNLDKLINIPYLESFYRNRITLLGSDEDKDVFGGKTIKVPPTEEDPEGSKFIKPSDADITGRFKTYDNSFVFFRYFSSDFEKWNTGTVIIVHGLGEHVGMYESVAKKFKSNGFNVILFDLRGYGQSAGKKGYLFDLESLFEDMKMVLMLTCLNGDMHPLLEFSQLGKSPIYLYGHDVGCLLILGFLSGVQKVIHNDVNKQISDHVLIHDIRDLITGVIIQSPCLRFFESVTGIQKTALNVISYFTYRYTMSVEPSVEFLTNDKKYQRKIEEDEMRVVSISNGQHIIWENISRDIVQDKVQSIKPKNISLFMVVGSEDTLAPAENSKLYYDSLKYIADKKFVEVNNGKHSLHLDTGRNKMFVHMIEWCLEKSFIKFNEESSIPKEFVKQVNEKGQERSVKKKVLLTDTKESVIELQDY